MNTSNEANEYSQSSHIENIRNNYETTDMSAIMGRFFEAVSWRNEE